VISRYPRKTLLVMHVGTSVGFLGAVTVFFCLAVAGLASADPTNAKAFYAVMPTVTWWVVVPLAFASLAIGIFQAALSPWGLVRHYWVVVKLAMTIAITAVLMTQTPSIDRLGHIATTSSASMDEALARYSVLLHSGAGIVAIIVVLVLSVVKPRGLTGWAGSRTS
jgi:hypothetical protein